MVHQANFLGHCSFPEIEMKFSEFSEAWIGAQFKDPVIVADLHSKILDAPLDLDVLIFMHGFNENLGRIFGRRLPMIWGWSLLVGYPGSAPDCLVACFLCGNILVSYTRGCRFA